MAYVFQPQQSRFYQVLPNNLLENQKRFKQPTEFTLKLKKQKVDLARKT